MIKVLEKSWKFTLLTRNIFYIFHVYTEISFCSWKFGLKSWKSHGNPLVKMCKNPDYSTSRPWFSCWFQDFYLTVNTKAMDFGSWGTTYARGPNLNWKVQIPPKLYCELKACKHAHSWNHWHWFCIYCIGHLLFFKRMIFLPELSQLIRSILDFLLAKVCWSDAVQASYPRLCSLPVDVRPTCWLVCGTATDTWAAGGLPRSCSTSQPTTPR